MHRKCTVSYKHQKTTDGLGTPGCSGCEASSHELQTLLVPAQGAVRKGGRRFLGAKNRRSPAAKEKTPLPLSLLGNLVQGDL